MDLAPPAVDAAPAPISTPAPAPPADLDAALSSLTDRAREFARTPPRDKAAMLRAIVPRLLDLAPDLAAAVARSRDLDPSSDAAAEAWIAGPAAAIAYARALAASLDDIASAGRPALDARDLVKRPDGRLVARVVPRSWTQRMAERGRETFVLFAEGTEPEDVIAGQAVFYRGRDPEGSVAVVVAAPHDATAGLTDALHALFVEGKVALLAERSASIANVVDRALAPLVERGFVRVVETTEGEISAIDPATATLVTAAPGGASPVIVVPCLYAKDELAFVTARLASELAHGGGADPAAPRVIVISSSWLQRGLFLELLAERFAAIPARGEPWTILPSLDPDADEPIYAATSGSSIGVVALSSQDPVEHLAAATTFANERLSGTLSAEIVVHSIHEEDRVVGEAVDHAAIGLRHGAVGINQWPALLRFAGVAPWGARESGFRNDALMLPRVDKAVLRGPLVSPRSPLFFQRDPKAARIARRLPAFAADPRVGDLFALVGR